MKQNNFLSILIPTFNRSKDLIKNLNLLKSDINNSNLWDDIDIIVSNNNSTDDTDLLVLKFKNENPRIKLNYYKQIENIGLERNALFVLKESHSDFVMYLGDDDFLDENYLKEVVNHLKNNIKTHSIISNFIPVDIYGKHLAKGRDAGYPNQVFKAGFRNCLKNSWRAHQLSGLVFKRYGIYDSYLSNKINNIYLFIYFLSISCLKGDTYHLTSLPVKVTQPGQENKAWGYGNDGLLNEVFDNYKKLPLNILQISILQLQFFKIQFWRLTMYKSKGFKVFLNVFKNIMFAKNGTYLFRIIFPFLAVYVILRFLILKKN